MGIATEASKTGTRTATWMGIAVVIMGLIAIAMPLATGVAITITLGLVLIITAIAQIVFAFQSDSFGSGVLRFVFGLLAGICGTTLISQPGAGLATITLFLAVWFFIDGVFAIVHGIRWRPAPGAGWMIVNGGVGIILGVMIYNQFPSSAAWLVGLMVGIRLLLAGWTMIVLGAVTRSAAKAIDKEISSVTET
ncbi:HdeD family acid-resistance protein [Halioglobus maricola]|uniref:HdeD family acid-resistance protein n=1 Tax=Halioglobus maricola TaxID=2601894 RepID=A0A5P9NJ94_9GAMM|nr:HdeD family acid-resistance protein [Halioglobus maricola]QFU75294.1 HdeD family acid-resistance protein [Halioglobus maricola]